MRSEPVDLTAHARQVDQAAQQLANPGLRRCAATYASFLTGLASQSGGLRRRQILLALTTNAGDRDGAQGVLERRASETTGLLRQAGVELAVIDGQEAAALLPRVLETPAPPAGSHLQGLIRC